MEHTLNFPALLQSYVLSYHNSSNEGTDSSALAENLLTDEESEQIGKFLTECAYNLDSSLDRKATNSEEVLHHFVTMQLFPFIAAREKYCEDALQIAAMTGVRQFVMLGAGYRTNTWKNSAITQEISVFEADFPEIQTDKISRCRRAGLKPPPNLHFAELGSVEGKLSESLLAAGFDSSKKTLFGCLGSVYYMTDSQLNKMLRDISGIAAEGSMIVFDYGDEMLFRSEDLRLRNMVAFSRSAGQPMQFCCDALYMTKLLETYHFSVYEQLDQQQIDFRYLEYAGISALEHIRFVTAVLKDSGILNTKEHILRTSLHLFAKHGYNGVSVRDIAAVLGITQSALYKHFRNKQAIRDEIVLCMEQNAADFPYAVISAPLTFPELKA